MGPAAEQAAGPGAGGLPLPVFRSPGPQPEGTPEAGIWRLLRGMTGTWGGQNLRAVLC